MTKAATVAKAITGALVCLAGYLVGVIPAEGGIGDVSLVQWLGALVFMGGAYGLVYRIPNTPEPAPRHRLVGEDGPQLNVPEP